MSNQSIDIVLNPVTRRAAPRPNGLWVMLGLIVMLAAMPLVASPYALLLMLPFVGYSIALLGFNLLFGNTGLLSFGHAMFLGVGAYSAAVLTSKLGMRSFELVLSPGRWHPLRYPWWSGSCVCAIQGYSSAC